MRQSVAAAALVAVLASVAMADSALAQKAAAPKASAASAVIESPTQVAYLQAKVKTARRHFAREAAFITGVPAEKILLCLPQDWRAGDPRYAVIPCLEKARRAPMNAEEKQKIGAADLAMKSDIAKARVEALKH